MSFDLSKPEFEWPEFEWDGANARRNLRVHGVSFPTASGVFLDPERIEDADTREEYDEDRYVAIGFASQVLLAVVFTLREKRIRLISARKANRSEEKEYRNRRLSPGPAESAPNVGE